MKQKAHTMVADINGKLARYSIRIDKDNTITSYIPLELEERILANGGRVGPLLRFWYLHPERAELANNCELYEHIRYARKSVEMAILRKRAKPWLNAILADQRLSDNAKKLAKVMVRHFLVAEEEAM